MCIYTLCIYIYTHVIMLIIICIDSGPDAACGMPSAGGRVRCRLQQPFRSTPQPYGRVIRGLSAGTWMLVSCRDWTEITFS